MTSMVLEMKRCLGKGRVSTVTIANTITSIVIFDITTICTSIITIAVTVMRGT